MKDKDKLVSFRPCDTSKYKNISLDYLCVYAVGLLGKFGADLSFENAVVACFKLFPNKFSLIGFPEYPDSDRVSNCLNRCTLKSKQWLGGKALHGFSVTDRSLKIASQVSKMLSGQVVSQTKSTSMTRRTNLILADLRKSTAFSKFRTNGRDEITDSELCFALQGTLDSSKDMLRENLQTMKNYADDAKDSEVSTFLEWASSKFEHFLGYKSA